MLTNLINLLTLCSKGLSCRTSAVTDTSGKIYGSSCPPNATMQATTVRSPNCVAAGHEIAGLVFNAKLLLGHTISQSNLSRTRTPYAFDK